MFRSRRIPAGSTGRRSGRRPRAVSKGERMRRPIHALALLAALVLTMAGCASGKATGLPAGPTTAAASKECGTIDMNDTLEFVPEECTAQVGQTVTWENVGGVPHTVTSEDGKFDSGIDRKSVV